MERTPGSDRLTVIAIAVIAYAGLYITHEIIGHCGAAGILGTRCRVISSTNIPLVKAITEIPAWKYNIILVAGTTANWVVGLICLVLLRAWRIAQPALRYFLWLSMCVNLFLPSGYMAVAPIIRFGDAYFLISSLPDQFIWRAVVALVGAVLCLLSFVVCLVELRMLIGYEGRAARSIAWQLVLPAYIAGGTITVMSAFLSELAQKWAQLQAVGGTFGLTVWLLFLPFGIRKAPTAVEHPFVIPRSVGWIVAGALVGLIYVGVLGPGIHL